MTRIRTRFNYHDSILASAVWVEDRALQLTFTLDGHWNQGLSCDVPVTFQGVRNRAAVESALQAVFAGVPRGHGGADVVGLTRTSSGTYAVDTSQGMLTIEAATLSEP